MIATASDDGSARLWSAEQQGEKAANAAEHNERVLNITFNYEL